MPRVAPPSPPATRGIVVTVASDKTFGWKPPCPYCGGKITFRASGWVEEADGTWTATDGDIECSTEPDIDSRVWQEWSDNHGGYDWGDKWHQLQERIIAALRRKVRFTFQNAMDEGRRTPDSATTDISL